MREQTTSKDMCFVLCLLTMFTCPLLGRTMMVRQNGGGDYDTIQAAINDANEGDVVVVTDGVYTGPGNRDIDFLGKVITVRSENGPKNCVIDCKGTAENPYRGFYFHSGEGQESVLEGLTIINGYGLNAGLAEYPGACGGAVYCFGSSPTLKNCIAV